MFDHVLLEGGRSLVIVANEHDRRSLAHLKEKDEFDFYSDRLMFEAFDDFIGNAEYEWISSEETGDLTDAPMLGTRDEEGNVTSRFAFMDYQVESILNRLLETGEAILVS